MEVVTDGIVLKARPYGERDMILTLLTPEHGRITVLARSVGKNKKQSVLYAQNFVFSHYVLFKGKGMYVVNSADVEESFYGLRQDISRLALAQYFADVAAKSGEENDAAALCSLLLNSLYLLSSTEIDERLIKLVFETKYCMIEGVFPEVLCSRCEKEPVKWSFKDGFCCEDCGNGYPITPGMISALRHISKNEGKKAYLFSMNEDSVHYLSKLLSDYVSFVTDTDFPSLEYYRSLRISL
ncbi:MAG: DNA repair protein RecO [Clostridia bacterium]|nr:DNA repair protein RecO [Clostridia bacterium]